MVTKGHYLTISDYYVAIIASNADYIEHNVPALMHTAR